MVCYAGLLYINNIKEVTSGLVCLYLVMLVYYIQSSALLKLGLRKECVWSSKVKAPGRKRALYIVSQHNL